MLFPLILGGLVTLAEVTKLKKKAIQCLLQFKISSSNYTLALRTQPLCCEKAQVTVRGSRWSSLEGYNTWSWLSSEQASTHLLTTCMNHLDSLVLKLVPPADAVG